MSLKNRKKTSDRFDYIRQLLHDLTIPQEDSIMNAQQLLELSNTIRQQVLDQLAASQAPTVYAPVPVVATEIAPLKLVEVLPTFDGNCSDYAGWRSIALNAMSAFSTPTTQAGQVHYHTAVSIFNSKIIGKARSVLTDHGTVLNFEAIINRLDQSYADKRPIHMIETELSNLRQGNSTPREFYDKICVLLTLLINKVIMTYGNDSQSSSDMKAKERETALRQFIRGLNPPLNNTLYNINPPDLPTAIMRVEEILMLGICRQREYGEFRPPRNSFRQEYNYHRSDNGQNHQFRRNHGVPFNNQNRSEPMEVDDSARFRQNTQSNNAPKYSNSNNFQHFKRQRNESGRFNNFKNKTQRINNLEERNNFLG